MSQGSINKILNANSSNDDAYGAWSHLRNYVANRGDESENSQLDEAVANGICEAYVYEWENSGRELQCTRESLVSCSMVCLSRNNATKVATSGIIPALVRLAARFIPEDMDTGPTVLTCITNLALHDVAKPILLQNTVLDVALSLLHYLDSSDTAEIDLGLTSASLICRLVGKEESGPGPEAIKNNSLLVKKLEWILTEVLDVGETGTVIGYHWDPANIMADIATLSTSDQNKPLLVNFVEQITRAMELRSKNTRMISLAVFALSQLYFEEKCRPLFDARKPRIIKVLDATIKNLKTDRETKANAEVLKASLQPKELSEHQKTTILKKFLGSRKPSVTKAVMTTTGPAPAGHVMISYQWDSQPIAIEIVKRMKAAKVKTWFDLDDMGANINDSMAQAVEGAFCIVVLFGRKYKESSNCRKECEMADNLQKPMIYVKIEHNYKQEAWLNLVMGKALWMECTQPSAVDTVFPQLAKRIGDISKSVIDVPKAVAGDDSAVSTPAETTSHGSSDEVITLLKSMMTHIEELKKEVKELREEVRLNRQ